MLAEDVEFIYSNVEISIGIEHLKNGKILDQICMCFMHFLCTT